MKCARSFLLSAALPVFEFTLRKGGWFEFALWCILIFFLLYLGRAAITYIISGQADMIMTILQDPATFVYLLSTPLYFFLTFVPFLGGGIWMAVLPAANPAETASNVVCAPAFNNPKRNLVWIFPSGERIPQRAGSGSIIEDRHMPLPSLCRFSHHRFSSLIPNRQTGIPVTVWSATIFSLR